MRLIDADALDAEMYHKSFEVDDGRNVWNSGLWIRYKIFEEAIRDAPTVDAVPMTWITDYEAKIVQNLVEIVQSKNFDDDEFHMQTCLLMAVAELQTTWAERKEE